LAGGDLHLLEHGLSAKSQPDADRLLPVSPVSLGPAAAGADAGVPAARGAGDRGVLPVRVDLRGVLRVGPGGGGGEAVAVLPGAGRDPAVRAAVRLAA